MGPNHGNPKRPRFRAEIGVKRKRQRRQQRDVGSKLRVEHDNSTLGPVQAALGGPPPQRPDSRLRVHCSLSATPLPRGRSLPHVPPLRLHAPHRRPTIPPDPPDSSAFAEG